MVTGSVSGISLKHRAVRLLADCGGRCAGKSVHLMDDPRLFPRLLLSPSLSQTPHVSTARLSQAPRAILPLGYLSCLSVRTE
jgi:hypothetical protein